MPLLLVIVESSECYHSNYQTKYNLALYLLNTLYDNVTAFFIIIQCETNRLYKFKKLKLGVSI